MSQFAIDVAHLHLVNVCWMKMCRYKFDKIGNPLRDVGMKVDAEDDIHVTDIDDTRNGMIIAAQTWSHQKFSMNLLSSLLGMQEMSKCRDFDTAMIAVCMWYWLHVKVSILSTTATSTTACVISSTVMRVDENCNRNPQLNLFIRHSLEICSDSMCIQAR